jgi:hypothetical protein
MMKSGQPSVVSDVLSKVLIKTVVKGATFTISTLLCEFPQILCAGCYEMIIVRLNYRKFCIKWVQNMLKGVHKMQIMALTFQNNTTKI